MKLNKLFLKSHSKKTFNKYPNFLISRKHLTKFGCIGLKLNYFKQLTNTQLVLIIKTFNLVLKSKKYKFWNLLYLNQNLTKLASESRMGKGKGSIYETAIFVQAGTTLFEIDNLAKIQNFKKIICKNTKLNFNFVKRLIQ